MFYVSFVVPIGTDVLGSAKEQGFITRLVAHRLNLMCAIALATMLIETLVSWKSGKRILSLTQLTSVALIGGLLAGLLWLHPQMDQLLEIETHRVLERREFYSLHRVYLWFSTFQWIFAWFWLYCVIQNWSIQNRDRMDAELPTPS